MGDTFFASSVVAPARDGRFKALGRFGRVVIAVIFDRQGMRGNSSMPDPRRAPHAPGAAPNPRYGQRDWNEVSDNPEWTGEELANAKPFSKVFPDLPKRGLQKEPRKVPTSIRLDPDVIAALRATGAGWQSRINELLREALRRPRGSGLIKTTGGKRAKTKPARRTGGVAKSA